MVIHLANICAVLKSSVAYYSVGLRVYAWAIYICTRVDGNINQNMSDICKILDSRYAISEL